MVNFFLDRNENLQYITECNSINLERLMLSKLPSSQFDEEWLQKAEKTEEDGGCDIGAGFRSYEVPNAPIDGILITPPTPERS
jgi:hypothetical protein